jgi:hypothetical protein
MRVGFNKLRYLLKKSPVRHRNCRCPVLTKVGAIRKGCFQAPVTFPKMAFQRVLARLKDYHFMISAKKNGRARLFQFEEKPDDLARCRAMVDVIAEEDDLVVRLKPHLLQRSDQRATAAVNISYGQGSHGELLRRGARQYPHLHSRHRQCLHWPRLSINRSSWKWLPGSLSPLALFAPPRFVGAERQN